MLAAFKIRAVPVNVNFRYVEEELLYLFGDADAKAVIFHREFAPKLAAIRSHLPQLSLFVERRGRHRRGPRPARRHVVRRRAGRRRTRARLRTPLGRRPLHPLHRRNDRDAEGRHVAPRGHLLRCLRWRELRRSRDHEPRGDRRERGGRAHPLPAGVPVHARHRPLDGVHHPLQRRRGDHLVRPPIRPHPPVGARRARAGQLPRHRR